MIGKLLSGTRLAAVLPVVAQMAGGGAALAGTYLLVGTAWTLLSGGLTLVALGALREAKVI